MTATNLTTITACVIARDEADNLPELLPQLRWADELLVLVDSRTTDDTAAIARPLADRVEILEMRSFSSFRNMAIDLARSDWIFFVDADERVSPDLVAEIRAAVTRAPVGYWIPRHNVMFGRLVRGGGWSPDYQLRLIRRGYGRYDEKRLVHETVVLDGPDARLNERLLHFNYGSIGELVEKQRRYTAMEAEALHAASGRPRARALVSAPAREFFRRYISLGGWVDGPVGFLLSVTMAYFACQRIRIARELPA